MLRGENRRSIRREPALSPENEILHSSSNSGDKSLTKRQQEVLELLECGKTYQDIADALGVQPWTAKRHIANIYERLEVSNRAQACFVAKRLGLMK